METKYNKLSEMSDGYDQTEPLTSSSSSTIAEEDREMLYTGQSKRKRSLAKILRKVVIHSTLFTMGVLSVLAFQEGLKHGRLPAAMSMSGQAAHVEELPTVYRKFNWWTEYSDKNETEADENWNAINTAHGVVAVDRTWALSNNWPDSMHLPSDDSKNLYLLEAYHLLHCLSITRTILNEAVRGVEEYTWNPPHAGHCLDTLRQYIICRADNTPLFSFGSSTAGDGQLRKCQSWDALRDWATEHTACYRDFPEGVDRSTFPLGAHFGYCDDGTDGVIVDAERRGTWGKEAQEGV